MLFFTIKLAFKHGLCLNQAEIMQMAIIHRHHRLTTSALTADLSLKAYKLSLKKVFTTEAELILSSYTQVVPNPCGFLSSK